MPNIGADEIITQLHVRHFVQWGGPIPDGYHAPVYAGQDAQYMTLTALTANEQGAISPIWVPDPSNRKQYQLVGRSVAAPDLDTATLTMMEKHGALPRQLQRIQCPFNVYDTIGQCQDPSDFLNGWSDYVYIHGGGVVTTKDLGDRSSFDSDEALEDGLNVTWSRNYPIGGLAFQNQAENYVTLEVADVVYASRENCADCGPQDDGTGWIYAVTKSSGSTPGTAPRLIYTVDGGRTWLQGSITGLGDTEDPVAIDVVGQYLVVATRTAGGPLLSGYYYAEINAKTGVPGTFTKVIAGFASAVQIWDMYVLSPREVFFCADNGCIYKSTDITSGVYQALVAGTVTSASLRRIAGAGEETIIAVGASGTIVVSQNRGVGWGTSVTVPVGDLLQAACVVDGQIWWVGSNQGRIYRTVNGGETWAEKGFSGSGSGQVYDIISASPEVLFMSHANATPTGRIFTCWDGGENWTNSRPRILQYPVATRFNRLAVPQIDPSLAANNVAVAGLGANGTDGILLLGQVSRI